MNIYTSNFAKHANHINAVSIARGNPKFYKGRNFIALAPSWDLVTSKMSAIDYEEHYYRLVLSKLNPHIVASKIGDGAVMLCWEKSNEFCHRHLVSNWLRAAGINCYELKPVNKEKRPSYIKKERKIIKINRDGSLNQKQNEILNLYEIMHTYPREHNQRYKILSAMKQKAALLSDDELNVIYKLMCFKLF